MRLLLDTCIVLTWQENELRLAATAAKAIRAAEVVYVSVLVPWEISIKSAAGKLTVIGNPIDDIIRSGFTFLPVTPEHAWQAGQLPRIHHDPFDRIFIAQAQIEGLVLVTSDRHIPRYPIATMSA